MADKTILQLVDITTLQATDEIPVARPNTTNDNKATMTEVKTFVNDGMVAIPTAVGDGTGTGDITIASLASNTDYSYGELSSLTITAVVDSPLASSVTFTSGSTPTTINLPSSCKWVGGEKPTACEASRVYMLTFCNGVGVFTDLGAAS